MQIEKGSEAAWIVRALVEAWIVRNEDELGAALDRSYERLPSVVWHLILLVGGGIEAWSIATGIPVEEVQQFAWTRMAESRPNDSVGETMRAIVTAYASGDEQLVEMVNDSGIFNEHDPDELMICMLAVAQIIARELTESINEPFAYATDGWWESLGVQGDDPFRSRNDE